MESAYEECLCYELTQHWLPFERQKELPVQYKNVTLKCGYRIDVVVDEKVILELKCVETILPVHKAQIVTYLKLTKMEVGLIINFHEPVLRDGIKRFVL
jgi:GxxExxY protein